MLEKNNVIKEMLFQMTELIYKSSELHELLIKKYSINIENILNNISFTKNEKELIEKKILFSIVNIQEYLLLFSEAFADWNSKNNKETVYEIFIFSNILYCIKGCIEAIFSSFEKLKLITKSDLKKIKSDLSTICLMEIRKVVTHSTHAKFDNNIEYYLFRNPLNNDELNTLPRSIYKLSNNKLEKVYFEMNFVVESIKKFNFFLEEIKNIIIK